MSFMKRRAISLILATLCAGTLSGCGYQGFYRYPCQDPENWENQECNPPECNISNTCWKELVGYDEEKMGENP